MAEISKADWKLFCERVPEWQVVNKGSRKRGLV